jgi:hypothetical protein
MEWKPACKVYGISLGSHSYKHAYDLAEKCTIQDLRIESYEA